MLAEDYEYVIGGDPDRDTIDLAVLDTATGRTRAHLAAPADGAGYGRMLDWASQHAPGRRVWALEGTGSFAAGLADALAGAGEDVVEVGALKRRRGAKNDRLDAVRAARSAMARDHQASPRARGLREAIRALAATRHAVLISRTKAINELKSLIIVAPEHLRASLRGRPLARQLDRIQAMTTSADATIEHRITTLTLQSITARIRFLAAQLAELDPELTQLVRQHPAGPALLAEPGVGPVVAAQMLISWSHPGRVRDEAAFACLAGVAPLEASSGQQTRHRLNRGGDRALNRALHTVAITRMRCHPKPALTKPGAPPRARHTATSGAASSAPSPGASTASWSPRPARAPLDKHRSVQRLGAPRPAQDRRSAPVQPGRPGPHRRRAQRPPRQIHGFQTPSRVFVEAMRWPPETALDSATALVSGLGDSYT